MPYAHQPLEQKWQKFWLENKVFKTENPTNTDTHTNTMEKNVSETGKKSTVSVSSACVSSEAKPKKYILDMFPYPSGSGLHVGHPKGYTATDIISRYYHANGYNVLHPMGWDAFGLPAENYAIKTGTHPAITTAENVATFRGQMQSLGFSYDWSREIDTTDPEYYKWTQWIFLELFRRGLAYEQDLPINYCPSCKTGLANEEVLSDNTCDRCGTLVERRPIRQWVLKITEYADRLIDDLEGLDWPEGVKEMQRNWIGRSEGLEFRMMKKVEGKPLALILHGWEDEGATSVHFHAWQTGLKRELEAIGYKVIMPSLPNPTQPDLESQLSFLSQYKDRITEDSIVIGHSMGGFLAMHFVEQLDKKIGKLICIAPVFSGLAGMVDWSGGMSQTSWNIGLNSMKKEYNPDIIHANVADWQIFLSKNDPYILYNEARNHFDQIGVTHVDVDNAGHFNDADGTPHNTFLNKIAPYISVYTTRVDTVFGMTYAVMAPDHPRVSDFITDDQASECEAYITEAMSKSDQDRTNEGKEKTGVFTGSYVVNPYNGESVPLWIADYVLGHYGTGAVMAVPAHDERDGAFAKRYHLPLKMVIAEYNILTGDNAPREGFPTREKECATLIVKHPTEEKYLVQNFENGELGLTGGAIEAGETPEQAARRELKEESGLADIKNISLSSIMVGHGFKARKEINCKDPDYVYAIELSSLDGFQKDCFENVAYKNEWLTKEEILQNQKFKSHHKKQFQDYLNGGYSTVDDGILMSSAGYSGLTSAEARKVLTEKAETEGFGHKKVNYKLRDWLFSRQRYWGEPIPLIHISHEDYAKLPKIEKLEDGTDGFASVIARNEAIQTQNNDSSVTGSPQLKQVQLRDDDTGEFLVLDGKVFSKIYDGINGKIVIDSRLPLVLPEVEKYEPAGDGQSPIATATDWVNIELAKNLRGKRETNTMPQWGGSCWYYLRFLDSQNPDALASKEALDYWQNVDEYVGGAEHAVLHLLYARFWHKVLYDAGIVPTKEPFQKLTNVGMILAYAYEREDGGLVAVDLVEEKDGKYFEISTGKEVKQVVAKMSKSLKNVVNPNDIVAEYGADTLRLYEMSMGAFTDTAPWNPDAIIGVRRFLDKVYATFNEGKNTAKDDMKAMKLLHKTIKKVGEDIVGYKFNTAISALMILLNEGIPNDAEFAKEWKEKFAIILHPFAPHMAEELWSMMKNSKGKIQNNSSVISSEDVSRSREILPGTEQDISLCSIGQEEDNLESGILNLESVYNAPWPEYDEFMLVDDEVTIAVQINGKLRGTLTCFNGISQEEVSVLAHADPQIAKWIEGKTLVKEIFIPNKMLSIVVK